MNYNYLIILADYYHILKDEKRNFRISNPKRYSKGSIMAEKNRLDNLLVEKGLAPTRSKALGMIMAGIVKVEDRIVTKAGEKFAPEVSIEIISPPHPYVSRGGLKLEKALDHFKIVVQDKVCLDAGASTGGFTHCLLLKGAEKVYAVDVGYGQLDLTLRKDSRVVNIEKCNVRYLSREQVPEDVDIITADLSFISLSKVVPVLDKFLKPGGQLIPLIKPQFEAEIKEVKKGVVRSTEIRNRVVEKIISFIESVGYETLGVVTSPIKGPKGNVEYVGCFTKKTSILFPENPSRLT
jgi:23S rRNA (cytidine1920-2'-O)/16S rRNA (cytidine1409-2'-O)-methyltransferase